MTDRRRPSWPLLGLGACCAGAIAAAILVVGPAPASQTTVNRTATVARGVVQSTVSGSGNLQPASQLNLGFKTAGTVSHIYVHQGQQVAEGQLLAALDPESAEVTLQQARASLQSAEASLASEEETGGEGSSSQASASSGGAKAATATTPAATTPASKTPTDNGASGGGSSSTAAGTTSNGSASSTSSSSNAAPTISAATREANIASAKAAVSSDRLTVQSAEQAVTDTRLYAPRDGTIASLSGQVGEVVSGSGTTRASDSEGSSGASTTAASGTGRTGSNTAATSSSSSSSSSSASSFAVLSDLSSMRLVVPLSESEIGSVRTGQIATVTVEALQGRKLAAHVGEVAILSTSNSGVVSYDVTFVLDQMDSGLKPGMSATAEVVVKQAQGLNVPSSAIGRGSATVVSGSKRETRRVTTGLVGDSTTIVTSGLSAGETVALPSATTRSTTTGATGALRGLRGLAGGAGGGAAFPGAGGGAFLRGGG